MENADFDEFGLGVTLVTIKSRFVVAIGGRNEQFNYPDVLRFARLDSLKLHKGWKNLNLTGY